MPEPTLQVSRRMVTGIGFLVLYGIGATAYLFTLSPKLSFLYEKQQQDLEKAIALEYKLREFTGIDDAAFEVILRSEPADANRTQVYVQRTGAQYPIASIEYVANEHPHPAEMRGGTLFVLRKVPTADFGTTPLTELWRYDITGRGRQLHAASELDFRASPEGSQVAVLERRDTVVLYNLSASMQQYLPWEVLAGQYQSALKSMAEERKQIPEIRLLAWSEDGRYFWGWLGWAEPEVLFRIHAKSQEVLSYDVSTVPMTGTEMAIHPTEPLVLFSTYPSEPVTLYLYNLQTEIPTVIAQSTNRPFAPRWLSEETIEYNHGKNQQRVIQTLNVERAEQ